MPDHRLADAVAELDALLEVANDLAEWLAGCANTATVVGQPAEVARDLADWHGRLTAQAHDAARFLAHLAETPATVPCEDCSTPVRADEAHDDDAGARYCEACCPKCSTNDAAADVPAPPELLP